MLEAARAIISEVSEYVGLSEDELTRLLAVDASHEFEIALKSGKVLKAYRVQHNNKRGPYKGGVRFHPDVEFNEVTALATLMSLKTAAMGLPFGGGKGGVQVNPRDHSQDEIEEIARKYVRGIAKHIGPHKDVPAPDVNTNSQIIDWMVDEYRTHTNQDTVASFTGKSLNNGGSKGREAATGRGGVFALQEYLKLTNQQERPIDIAVQGIGNVGEFFGRLGPDVIKNWRLVAATDSSGGVYEPNGLLMKDLIEFKKSGKKLIDYNPKKSITNDDFLDLKVDVLAFAALGDVVNSSNMHQVNAQIILELANGPLSYKAHKHVSKKGAVVIPDILANAGGVTVSYLEWEQNNANQQWSEDTVNTKLEAYIRQALEAANTYSLAHKLPLKEAAIALAIERIVK